MQVHDEQVAEERGRLERTRGVPGHQHQGKHEAHHEAVEQDGYVVEHLSRVYGYAVRVLVPTILFVVGVSFPEYTLWPGGATNTTAPGEAAVVPRVNSHVWTVYLGLLFPAVVALRTMFATSSGDPHPLPGEERYTWKYAPQ